MPPPDAAASVSIVLATFNRATMLRAALDSALAQDHADLEVLVMDDGSSDETPAVLAEYAARVPAERLRVERHDNMGQARTLNRGYALARGEWVGYLSDDDLLAPGLVSALLAALAATPGAVAAYPAYRLIDADDAIIDTWRPLPYTPATALTRHDTIIGPGGLVRRDVLEATGAWDPAHRWMGDLPLWMAVGREGPVVRVDAPLASWRQHAGGATSTGGVARAKEHLRLWRAGVAAVPEVAGSPALRAEALRNACLTAAWFAGHTELAPGVPLTSVDQDRPRISAWASGQDPAAPAFDGALADRVATSLRELGRLTVELATVRRGTPAPAGGPEALAAAEARLEALGAFSDGDELAPGADRTALGFALVEAAVRCGELIDPATARFLAPDRETAGEIVAELGALVHLSVSGPEHGAGFGAAIEAEIARRRDDIAAAERSRGLEATLESPLPAHLPEDRGTAVFCAGTCRHRDAEIATLEVAVNGVRHPVPAVRMPRPDLADADPDGYRSGFWTVVPLPAGAAGERIALDAVATLGDGTEAVARLGVVEVVAPPAPPPCPDVPACREPGLIAVCMATYEPDAALLARPDRVAAGADRRALDLPDQRRRSSARGLRADRGGWSAATRASSSPRSPRAAGFYRNFERALAHGPAPRPS